ncbi:hypothetical protein [Roseateles paludis]|uniref:DUF3108 domain-containing protein n=1 Tax=Roseateles paludis TaxID=3145238 RepID=A0ABV0FY17_9BURK
MRLHKLRPALLALGLSAGLHAWWFRAPELPAQPIAAAAPALSVRMQAPPAAQPAVAARPAAPSRAQAQRLPSALAPDPTPAADPGPPAPLLRLAEASEWRYRLRQSGQDGEASLSWQPQADGRYTLRLTRRIGERTLPAWQSLGRMSPAGLVPERFSLQMRGGDRQATNFDRDAGRLSFSARPGSLDLPDGAQDRLSWWLQLAALLDAGPTPLPGARWRVWVAGLRGELREWVFELVEEDSAIPGLWHLRRQPLGPEDPGLEAWFDPARGHGPVRLRQGDPERRGFEIWLESP